jgi:hypothetical protein
LLQRVKGKQLIADDTQLAKIDFWQKRPLTATERMLLINAVQPDVPVP